MISNHAHRSILGTAALIALAACKPSAAAERDEPVTVATAAEAPAAPATPADDTASSDTAASDTAAPVTLAETHQQLAPLVGDWKGEGTLQMGGKSHTMTSDNRCRVAPGGVAVRCEHHGQIEGMGPVYESALFGIDPQSKKLHWYNVTSMGEAHDHVGQWTSKERLEWSYRGEQEGKPMTEAISMDLDGDQMTFRSETKVDGQRFVLFEGTMRR
jgi:hypothetical protein